MNNVCIAIAYARLAWGIERVAVVDFDAHFGNGTFSILQGDSRSFYASVHLDDIFPPTADADASSSANLVAVPIRAARTDAEAEAQRAPTARSTSASPSPSGGASGVGARAKDGKTAGGNVDDDVEKDDAEGESSAVDENPEEEEGGDEEEDDVEEEGDDGEASEGSTNMFEARGRLVGRDGFRRAIADEILPALHRFNPELVILSAGFDAHRDDPLGGAMGLLEEDFVWATRAVLLAASAPGAACGGRVISCLEGGYDVTSTNALANCVAAHVHALRTKPTLRAATEGGKGGEEGSAMAIERV